MPGAEFNACNVPQVHHGAIATTLQDDVAELLRRRQPARGVHQQLIVHFGFKRLCPEYARCNLRVLFANGAHDITRRQIASRNLSRVEPDAHGVVATA